jgi:hypothetical protein
MGMSYLCTILEIIHSRISTPSEHEWLFYIYGNEDTSKNARKYFKIDI